MVSKDLDIDKNLSDTIFFCQIVNIYRAMIIKKISSYSDPCFKKLQQAYEAEFSPITGYKPNSHGVFDQEFLANTWSKNGYEIYLFKIDETVFGFAVVNLSSMITHDKDTRDIAEFYIEPEFRNQKLGTKLAQELFHMYPGKWEVRQLPQLQKARNFWLKAITEMKPKEFQESTSNESWTGFLQKFMI